MTVMAFGLSIDNGDCITLLQDLGCYLGGGGAS